MGIFVSLSGVIGQNGQLVESSLRRFTLSVNGGLEQSNLREDDPNLAVMNQHEGNTTIIYPNDFVEWETASAFLSKDLNAAVFSLHIHNEDLWMFQLYHAGEVVARFNPVPDYWEEDLPEEEMRSWQGDATIVSQYVPGVAPAAIEKYFVTWNWEDEGQTKAYPEDEYGYGDCWQLVDFMEKVGLQYPLDADGKILGKKFKLWTSQLGLER